MITLTLLPTVLFSVKVVTDIDCEITDDQWEKDWGSTTYGKNGGVDGGGSKPEGRLFEFDCQTWDCIDSEGEEAHEWVTCGYSWRESDELSDSSEVIVDVLTEAYNSRKGDDGCPDDFTRWLFLDPKGDKAEDTAGDKGDWDFHFCYKTATWSSVKSGDRMFVTDLYADTTGSGKSGYDQIAKWDTNNEYSAKAYGNNKRTTHFLYLFSKMAKVALPEPPVTLIGYWTYKNQLRRINEYTYTLTESAESSKREKMESEESEAWYDSFRTNHRTEVTTHAKGLLGKIKVGGSFGYTYEYEHTHNSQFHSTMSQLFDTTFTQSIEVTKEVTIPAQTDKIKDSNIWYFETTAINSKFDWAKRDMVDEGVEMAGCGYNIGPNCLPGQVNWAANPHGWVCKEPFAIIDPTFEIPYLEVGGVCMKSQCRLSSPITGGIASRNIKCYYLPIEECTELCSDDLNCKSIETKGDNYCCLQDCKIGEGGCVNDHSTSYKYYECERFFDPCPTGFQLTYPGVPNGECQQFTENSGEYASSSDKSFTECATNCEVDPKCYAFDFKDGGCYFNSKCDYQQKDDGYVSCKKIGTTQSESTVSEMKTENKRLQKANEALRKALEALAN